MCCRHGGTGLGLGIVRSLVQLMGGSIRIVEKTGPGAVFQFSICFQRAMTCETIPYSLPPIIEDTEVVLGVPDADSRSVASEWISKQGLRVHQVETWEQILLHLRYLNGSAAKVNGGVEGKQSSSDDLQQFDSGLEVSTKQSSRGVQRLIKSEFLRTWKTRGEQPFTSQGRQLMVIDASLLPNHVKPDFLEEYLQESGFVTGSSKRYLDGLGLGKLESNLNRRKLRDPHGNLSVVWVTSSNTHEPIKAALRAVQHSFIVRRPLHTARLKEIFQLIAREGDPLQSLELENPPEILASNTINYVKQQQWNDPYACDNEVSTSRESLSLYVPTSTVTVHGRNVRHRPTAAKSAPPEEISYSEMETKSIAQNTTTDQGSMHSSSTTTTSNKPVKRSVPRLAHPNGKKSMVHKPLENLEILVAEDTPLLRKLAAAMLQRLGAITHEASNGQEVLEFVLTRMRQGQIPFHCILMDCQVGSFSPLVVVTLLLDLFQGLCLTFLCDVQSLCR